MANSKIYLGNTNIGSLFQGADDISIYLGENKVYPLAEPSFKWKALYSDSHVESAQCGSSSEIVRNEINKTNLVSVEIGDCVTSIGDMAFYFYRSLTSVSIGTGVTYIGASAFEGCTGLTSIDIPSGVTSIGPSAFQDCDSLTSITVNAITPPQLDTYAFNYTNNCPIYVPCESVNAYKSASGWSDYSSRIACPPFEGKFKATYSDGREYDLACDGNTTLTTGNTKPTGYEYSAMTEAVIGECVTTIGNHTFNSCSSLSAVTMPSGLTSIGNSVFSGCTSLTSIDIPDSVTSIGNSAFAYCSGITSVVIPSGVTNISNYMFFRCSGLTSIDIPDSVTSISGSAFNGCSSLASIDIPSGVTSIGSMAFYGCAGLSAVTIPNSVVNLSFSTFSNCTSLTSITMPSGITSIPSTFFAGCSGLTSIDIPSGVTSIGNRAFSICSSLASIDIPSGVTSIGENAFASCDSLTGVTINATTPPTLGTGAFDNANNCPIYVPCESVEAYKSASGWSDYASRITCVQPLFEGKWKATYSDSSVTSAECDSSSAIVRDEISLDNLVSVEIGDCVTSIGDKAFRGCSSLTNIVIPDSVTTIGMAAFFYCDSLTSITIPSGVTSIVDYAFGDCRSLTSITVNATTPPTLGGGAFDGSTCPIYVPSASVNAYKSASGWSTYASRIQAIP